MVAYAEHRKLDVMMTAALAEGTAFGDSMTGLAAGEVRQLWRKSAARDRLARARDSGSARAAATAEADYRKVSAEADMALGGCAARRREIILAANTSLSAVSGQVVRARDARDVVISLARQLRWRREAAPAYALELRKLALLQRGLAALVKIEEGLEELEQVEHEMAALDRSLEQAAG